MVDFSRFGFFIYGPSDKRPVSKGNSLLIVPSDYTVIDLETTGLDYFFDEIIELAAVRVRDFKIVDTYQCLIKPAFPIDEFITELTGITNEMVESAPSIQTKIKEYCDFIGDDIVVAHNANFDVKFVSRNLENTLKKPFLNDFVDTLRLSRWFYKDFENHKLSTVAANLDITRKEEHRALDDCYTCKSVVDKIHQRVIDENINLDDFFSTKSWKADAKTISTTKTEFDEEHFLFNKYCVFTGVLEKMKRADAMQIVADFGGNCQNSVTKQTNVLVLGSNDYCSTIKDGKTAKHKKAEEYILKGHDLTIISEDTFYDLIF